ncbi:MAG TPA: hypothetical protein VIW21_09740 [Chthoniobacterales bacterium]
MAEQESSTPSKAAASTPESDVVAPGEGDGEQGDAQKTEVNVQPRSTPQSDNSALIGGIIWMIILVGIGVWWFTPHNRAQVFVEVSRQPARISGVVLFKGAAVNNGAVHITFGDPKTDLYLGGTTLPVAEGGTFTTLDNSGVVADFGRQSQEPLRIAASFSGQQPPKKEGAAPTSITANTTLYLNYPPPVGKWTRWTFAFITLGLAILLITLFTGDLTRRKARMLFSITYIMTFMSLAAPICAIIWVSKSQYAVEMMEEAPVGLIKGTARGVKHPQWLVNLGGAVARWPKKNDVEKEVRTPPEAERPAGGVSTSPPAAATPQPSPTPPEGGVQDEIRPTPGFDMVRGGLAVPFYVIILATLGAGINMTKKVPDIQKQHDIQALPRETQSMVSAALRAPAAAFGSGETQVKTQEGIATVSGIRKDLIDTYMGLISAPFLAIAVYYLLQMIATDIAEPVLVLVAFATGFISDSIVTAITTFASDTIKSWQGRKPESAAEGEETETENE